MYRLRDRIQVLWGNPHRTFKYSCWKIKHTDNLRNPDTRSWEQRNPIQQTSVGKRHMYQIKRRLYNHDWTLASVI
nr:MAG TPA: hypothetical protein [Caudoviricetes sp.]